MEASNVEVPACDDMEVAACPRCGSSDGSVVVEGRDYLHGLEGRFFGWECAGCGLQYQNPRPTAERLAHLYPSNYAPHVAGPSGPVATTPRPSSWTEWLKWRFSVSRFSSWIKAIREGLRYLRCRIGIGFLHPTYPEVQTYLRRQMGYRHLEFPASSSEPLLTPALIRECRRVTGIDLIPAYVAGGRLLEIGCATGERLQSYRVQGWKDLHGIELTEQAATQAQQRGFEVECGQVEVSLNKLPDEYYDVIVSSMVLEHLYDPFAVARTIARKLKPGGEFLFSTVTRDALDARWFGKYWSGYDFPRHMVYLRMADIHEMVAEDFDQVECFHQNAPVDFLRPATWRRPENKLSDRLIAWLAKARVGLLIGEVLARKGQTCRVSFRCRRK